MPNSRARSDMASPSSRRATKRRRSSITEHSFQGISTSRLLPHARSVTHVSGTICHLCLGSLKRLSQLATRPSSSRRWLCPRSPRKSPNGLRTLPTPPWANEKRLRRRPFDISVQANGLSRAQAVACASHGTDRVRLPRLQQRLAQPPDVHVDSAIIDVNIVAPYVVEKLLPREHATGRLHHEFQQAVVRRPQMHHLAA